MHYFGFCWVPDLSKYEASVSLYSRGVVPIIRPLNKQRERNWRKILHWYGLREAHTSEFTAIPNPHSQTAHRVIALNPLVDAVASAVAYITAGRFLNSATKNQAGALRRTVCDDAITFIGLPGDISSDYLRGVTEKAHSHCQILTAWDVSGLTFVVAKLAAARSAPAKDCSVIDTLRRETFTVGEYGPPICRNLLDRKDVGRIVRQSHNSLVFCAHGEGGHVSLDSVVFCGLFGDREQRPGGAIVRGCAVRTGKQVCKRVHTPEIMVLPFSRIKAERLALLTCLGSAMPHELHGTNISAVLDCMDGYLRTVLTTTSVTPIPENEPEVVANLLRQGAAATEIQSLLNDLHQRTFNSSPFVVFGDASGGSIEWSQVGARRTLKVFDGGSLVLLRWPNGRPPEIVHAACSDAVVSALAGDKLAVLLADRPLAGNQIVLSDYAHRLRQSVEFFSQLAFKAMRSAFWLQSIEAHYEHQMRKSRRFGRRWRDLALVRSRIENCAQSGLRACGAAKSSRRWDYSVEQLEQLASIHLRLWDQAFAVLTRDHLFDGALEQILLDAQDVLWVRTRGRCETCHSSLVERKSSLLVAGLPPQISVSCPNCGHREIRTKKNLSINYVVPNRLHGGSTATVEIQTERGRGTVAIEFRDKALDKVFFGEVAPARDERLSFAVHVPNNLWSELHTIRMAWCCEMDFTYLRLRRPS